MESLELLGRLYIESGPQVCISDCPFIPNYFLQSKCVGIQLLGKMQQPLYVDGIQRPLVGFPTEEFTRTVSTLGQNTPRRDVTRTLAARMFGFHAQLLSFTVKANRP
jgi:hypothetical protein